jgi:hypothetical protein
MLTPELETFQTLSPYPRPQDSLRIRGAASEVFCVYNQPFRQLSVTLSQPSPLKGEGLYFILSPLKGEGLNNILSPLKAESFYPHKSLKSLNYCLTLEP